MDRYLEGASSNPARVNIFQLTSAVSDYHKNFCSVIFKISLFLQKQTRELLIRLIYCEMLGQDASFGYIHAIKFAQRSSLLEKRTGKPEAFLQSYTGNLLGWEVGYGYKS